jgi:alpha-beta hydrolase superfamily lysophospholipase
MSILHDEGAVTQRAVPGPALYFVSAMPERPKAILGLLHGYADHGARYAHVMDHLAERGIGCVALDMRGHGRATGTRGYCSRFDEYLDDAAELARLVSDRARGAPVFLFGHSFGGLVSALSVLEQARSWRALVLSAPYFDLAMQIPAAKRAAGKIAGRLIPKLALPTGIKGSDLTHDDARGRAYEQDPLVFKEARARWFIETRRAQEKVLARAHGLTMPLYVIFGTSDPVAKLTAAKAFFDAAGSKDKTWAPQEGLRHETLNEPEWPGITTKMAEWILART